MAHPSFSMPDRLLQVIPGVSEAPTDVLVLGPQSLLESEAGNPGQGLCGGMRPDVREGPGQVPGGEVGEGRPVAVAQAGDVERVPGDHLQVEGDLRVGRPEGPDDPGQ